MAKIDQLRDSAYMETLKLLDKYKRAVIVRPTGFGKTGILTRLLKNYKKVIYLYPTDIIMDAVLLFYYGSADKIPADNSIKNVIFMSYMALAMLADSDPDKQEEILAPLKDADLIIADECHRIGAPGTSDGLDILIDNLPDAGMVGATATPERMDTVDEIARYFDDHMISEYNLHDAFKDGILKRPYYYYFNYAEAENDIENLTKEAENEINKIGDASTRSLLEKKLSASVIEAGNLIRMPYIIKNVCHKYAPDESYMSFIAFFATVKQTRKNGARVEKWFKEAYPDYEIRTLVVSSEDDQTRLNARRIKALKHKDKTIDLILSCNMMNMGYHVDSLTGILMYRGTRSGTVYTQQLGRVLSTGSQNSGIVFDIVDNIHSESVYQLLGRQSDNLIWRKKRQKLLIVKKEKHDAAIDIKENGMSAAEAADKYRNLTYSEISEIAEDPDEKEYTWNDADERELSHLNRTLKPSGRTASSKRRVPPTEDLIAVSHEATYRDLILKTVAEARSMRCRQAWARWLEEGGRAKDENGRPLSRREVLSQLPPEQIPLAPFCQSKSVSVKAVLDEMGVPDDGELAGIHPARGDARDIA